METKKAIRPSVNSKEAKAQTPKTNGKPSADQKMNVSNGDVKPETKQVPQTNDNVANPPQPQEAENKQQVQETPRLDTDKPIEPSKVDIKVQLAQKQAEQHAILIGAIKLGGELSRKTKHLENLENTIETLEGFELNLKADEDETDGNHYQGCTLTIVDDKGRTFTTKNPTIIKGVAEHVNDLCIAKLAEIRKDIISLLPA